MMFLRAIHPLVFGSFKFVAHVVMIFIGSVIGIIIICII